MILRRLFFIFNIIAIMSLLMQGEYSQSAQAASPIIAGGKFIEIFYQIVHLSIRYGIVTPYTSYLVTEQAPLGEAEQQRLADETFRKLQAMPTSAPSGQAAVQSAVDAGAMQGAASAPELEGKASSIEQPAIVTPTPYSPDRPASTPVTTTKPTQIPTQVSHTPKISGPCAGGLLSLFILPLVIIFTRKPRS